MKKSDKQPTPKKGFEFTGWTTFNWGICHKRVFRTRQDAKHSLTHYKGVMHYHWDELKDQHKIVKVKVTVL